MSQTLGLSGWLVDELVIRKAVRKRFHTVWWIPPAETPHGPAIFAANHHGWFDGFVMYVALTRLGLSVIDWLQEFDAFPLFRKVGGMPFPADDAAGRAATIRRTVRLMVNDRKSLLIFPEGKLHYPPELMPFGRALELISDRVPGSVVHPVAIRYEHSMHERPEAFIMFGDPVERGKDVAMRTRLQVGEMLFRMETMIREDRDAFQVMVEGTPDVSDRWQARRFQLR